MRSNLNFGRLDHLEKTLIMTYTLNIFAQLIAEYSIYDDLATYLRSEAGGQVQIIEGDDDLAIFHYDKKQTDMGRWSWMRSVVWDMVNNRPVAVAPPKATDVDDAFMAGLGDGMQIQEYLEGTTLNIFGGDQVASRTKFGASKGYYGAKTFREMLDDALAGAELSSLVPAGYTFASVLVQHPEHRVVEEVKEARVFVLHAGRVEADGTVVISETGFDRAPPAIAGPEGGQTISEWFAGLASSESWTWRGAVLKDGGGKRYRLKSNSYRMVRSLRGSTNRADERFLGLRAAGLMKTYLYYYPEDKQLYWRYETALRTITNDLYAAYCAVFKEKSLALADADPKLQVHVRGLHATYLGTLRPDGKTVVRSVAIQYINSQPIPRLLHLLNVDKRRIVMPATLPIIADSVLA